MKRFFATLMLGAFLFGAGSMTMVAQDEMKPVDKKEIVSKDKNVEKKLHAVTKLRKKTVLAQIKKQIKNLAAQALKKNAILKKDINTLVVAVTNNQ